MFAGHLPPLAAPLLSIPLLSAIGPDYTLQWVLLAGLSIWSVLLLSMMWTRWGQARPLLKCVILSVFAHVLLILFMWGTRFLNMLPPGDSLSGSVNARLVDDPGDEDLSPFVDEAPTESTEPPAPINAPPLLAAPPEPKPEQEPTPLEPAPPPMVAQQPLPQEQPAPELPMSPTADEAAPPVNSLREPMTSFADGKAGQFDQNPPATPKQFPVSQPTTTPRRAADGEAVAPAIALRMRSDRFEIAKRYGATPDSERAVVAALAWLAANQHIDGRWIAAAHGAGREMKALGQDRQGAGQKADTGITGLALLAFLASGQTHLEGEHREVIQKGLEFLLASQNANGSLSGEAELFAAMYCHGIATLAISEAYALTGDRRLHNAVNNAITYTLNAQHVGGGWRYQPHDNGDLSQFGWQLMALKSAEMAGFPIPDATRVRMIRFLRTVTAGRYKGLASYRPGDQVTRPMTAEALACRFFLDIDNSPETVEEAAAFVSQELPRGDRVNLYYWYYGTLALFQKHDADWTRWNNALQAELLPRQRGDGQYLGSWDPDNVWGGYGGRVYSTSLACLSLEASYRYLPVYADPLGAERFTEAPGSPNVRGTR